MLRLTSSRSLFVAVAISNSTVANAQALAPETDAALPADTQPAGEGQLIVVTGSRIPRLNLTAVSNVTVVRDEVIKLEGVTRAEELLNQLPMVSPDQGAFVSNGASGTATVDLRGLGATRTLVLLNGRRMAPGDPAFISPDLNAVPSALIKRVEVLTGGASSVYGSDAIAGVVNFTLDTRLEGLRIDGQISFFQHENRVGSPVKDALEEGNIQFPTGNTADGRRQDINAAYGTSFLDERGHVTVYAGYQKLSKLTEDQRDYSACALSIDEDRPDVLLCGGSSASYPGNFVTIFDDVYQIGPGRTFEPGFVPFNYAPWNFYQRSDRRYIGGGFVDLELNDALNPFVEIMYMDDRSVAQIAPSGNFFNTGTINCDNPLLSEQQRALVCFEGNFVGQVPIFDDDGNLVGIDGMPIRFANPITGGTYNRGWLFIGRRNVEGGPRRDDLRHKNLRLVGGAKGNFGRGLAYEASYIYGRVKFGSNFTNELSDSRIRRSLDVISDPLSGQPVCRSVLTGADPQCVPWDIFALGAVTPEATGYLALNPKRSGLVREQVATAFVTARLGERGIRSPWADEGPSLNVGAEYRKDYIDYRPDEIYQSGDLAGGSDFQQPHNGSVRVKELFGEIRIPLIEQRLVESLALEGGYRQSWYSNPENRFNTNSYKLALDFVPIRGLRLRASRQRAVRAPNIVELFEPTGLAEFDRDPCAGVSPDATFEQCARTGVTASQYGHILATPTDSFGYHGLVGGNPSLKPEKATTRSAGVVLEPRFLPGLSTTVDWFDIEVEGAITLVGPTLTLATCLETGDPLFCNRVHRDAMGSLWLSDEGFVDSRNANIGAFKVRGIDFGANYQAGLGRLGSANLAFLGSRLHEFVIDNGGLSTPRDCSGLYGFPCRVPLPRWRHQARMTWESRTGVSISWNWRYIGNVKLAAIEYRPEIPFNPRDAKLSAQNYFDLSALFRVGGDYLLRLGVNNIFDRQPPLVTGAPSPACNGSGCNGNTFPQLYDPLGRFFFAGVTVNLQ
ncbi:MAG: TonB-dependent receptor domain-containing protein [Sphingomicrobium sp.]